MKEKQILVIIKEPGKEPVVEPLFENTLEAFRKAVGGNIETVTIASGCVLICNEEGRLQGLPENVSICGVPFWGTVLAVGACGDEFASLKGRYVPMVMRMMKSNK